MKETRFDVQFFAEGGDAGASGGTDGSGTEGSGADGSAADGNTESRTEGTGDKTGTSSPEGSTGTGPEAPSLLGSAGKDTGEGGGNQSGKVEPDGDGKEDKKGDAKDDADGAAAAPLAVEDIVVPEGRVYDEELGKSFLDIVNDTSLTRKELANKLVAMYAGQQDKMLQGLQAADIAVDGQLKAISAGWAKAAKADSEYGGRNWEASQGVIVAGRDHLATPGAREILETYSLGDHPEIVRMFYRAGKLLGEDRMSGGGKTGQKKPDIAEAIFGDSLKEIKKGDND